MYHAKSNVLLCQAQTVHVDMVRNNINLDVDVPSCPNLPPPSECFSIETIAAEFARITGVTIWTTSKVEKARHFLFSSKGLQSWIDSMKNYPHFDKDRSVSPSHYGSWNGQYAWTRFSSEKQAYDRKHRHGRPQRRKTSWLSIRCVCHRYDQRLWNMATCKSSIWRTTPSSLFRHDEHDHTFS